MSPFAGWIVALLVKPTLVIGAAMLGAIGLRRKRAASRHGIWAGAGLAILALPLLGLILPPLRIPLLPEVVPKPVASFATPALDRDESGSDQALNRSTLARRSETDPHGVFLGFVGLWLSGVLLLGARRVAGALGARRLLLLARPARADRVLRLFASECRALRLNPRPRLLVSPTISAPAAAGALRPVVLLPTAAEQWSDVDLSAALIHELAHVQRRDCLQNLMADLAVIVYWCNPAVWFLSRRIGEESERAADELVLARGVEPETYAQLLLDVARTAAPADRMLPGVTAMARPREFEARLRAVLDDRERPPSPARWSPASLWTAGLLLALPGASLTLHGAPRTPMLPEPDRQADSLAPSESERVPWLGAEDAVPPGAVAALGGPDSALVARLIRALDHRPIGPADLVRSRAVWALAQARDRRLVDPLIEALDAPDWRVQAYAAWALAVGHESQAVPRLIDLLRHPVWRLRAMAAYALHEVADPRASRAMTEALKDPAWQVRVEAVGYFASLGRPEMLERLRALRQDRHLAVRAAVLDALTPRGGA